jgi:hypothetical protein
VSSVVGVTAGGSRLGAIAAAGSSLLGATAGGSTLGVAFLICTLGGRCDRRGFGIAGEVAMFPLLRRGTSGVPDGRALGTGATDTFGGALAELGAAECTAGRGKLGRGGSLTAGEA